jgi:hypothetical protein
MNKNDKILLFLGRVQARIEDLVQWASQSENQAFEVIAELESYFNRSLQELLSNDEDVLARGAKGFSWNTLPRP